MQETLVYQNGRVPLNNHNDVQTGFKKWFPRKSRRKKKFMKNHRSCRRHRIVGGTHRHPRRIIPKDEPVSQKTHRKSSQEFSTKQDPNKIIQKDVDPKHFYQQKMTAPKKCKNIRWHLYNLLKPWKTLDFLLEIHVGWNHPSFPCKGTSPRWVAPQVAKMGPGPMVIDGVLYNPYKWLEING